jgi:thiol-disulfide isomerase/thioredoxin
MLIRRRILLAAAGTVAAGWPAGKPRAALAMRAPFRSFSHLKPTDPPVPPPGFTWQDAAGKTHHLAEYAGQGVILNLWATWCLPCISELPALDAAEPAYARAKIAVLPLSSDRGGAQAVTAYFKAHGISHLPVLLDPEGRAERALGVRGIPTTLLIDRHGRERARFEGAANWHAEAVMEEVRALVG